MSAVKPKAGKLALILYEGQSAPRYYEFKKRFFKLLIYGLPIITLLSLLTASIIILYFQEIRNIAVKKEPAIILKLREEKRELINLGKGQSATIDDLEERLAKGGDVKQEFSTLGLFVKALGAKDLSTNPPISLEAIETSPVTEGIQFQFNIVNITKKDSRVSGHIFVLMKYNNQISFWPNKVLPPEEMKVHFNSGESFTTARFRPVKGLFPIPESHRKNSLNPLFKILIFSRAGDLMHKLTFNHQIQF